MEQMESDKWICAVCGRKNTGETCVQCGNPKGTEFKSHVNDFNEENDFTPPHENNDKKHPPHPIENNENYNSNNTDKNSNSKNEMYMGIITVLFFIIIFLGFKLYQDSNEDNIPHQREAAQHEISPQNNSTIKIKDQPSISPERESIPNKPTEPIEVINAKNENQRAAIKAFYDFHKNITEHNLESAYSFFSPDLQNQISYEGWSPGFNTTVSSTPSDVHVTSESDYQIILTYYLQAVDNPGGIQNFTGKVTLIKIANEWKIDDIYNKFR